MEHPFRRDDSSGRRLPCQVDSPKLETSCLNPLGLNALAETINGLYKTELVRKKGPWKTIEALEWETLNWVHWFNQTRLLEPIGYTPPAEFEALYERSQQKCLKAA